MVAVLDASASSESARDQLINEYVAVGGYGDADAVLSQRIDDITDHFGPEVYDRMLLDPEISARMELIKIAVLGDGLSISPRVRADDPRFERAKWVADFITFNLTRRGVNFRQFAYEMLDALAYGHKVAEITYEIMQSGPYKGKLVLKSLKVKPRNSVGIVVDRFLNIRGFVAFQRADIFRRGLPLTNTVGGDGIGAATGYTAGGVTAGPITNTSEGPRILPRIKFCVLTFRGRDGDPRGNSILRPCYNAWNFKQKMYPEWMLFLCNAAQPSVIGIAPPEGASPLAAQPQANEPAIDDATGKQQTDSAGKPKFQTAVQRLGAVLAKIRKSYAAAVPNGTTFEVLETKHDGSSYVKSIDACDRAITTAMCLATLGVREGQYMSRNAGSLHAGVIDMFIYFVKQLFLDAVVNDICTPVLELNEEDDAADLMPTHSLGDTERKDWAKEASAAAQLLNTNQLPVRVIQDLFIQLGFSPLDAGELAEIVQARLAAQEPPAEDPAKKTGPKAVPAAA